MMSQANIKPNDRDWVLKAYEAAIAKNKMLVEDHDVSATEHYTFPNQRIDALHIVDMFYYNNIRALSILKLTKIGMDGLMIEIAKLMTTHNDDNFILRVRNVHFLTGMSNVSWEQDFKEKVPEPFQKNIHHHGKLQNIKEKLVNIRDAIIIIDEIDCGGSENQKLHKLLEDSGILDINYMDENNIRFVFVSATMASELKALATWGERHMIFRMTLPDTYIGHREFLQRGIIQEYYPVDTLKSARRWVQEDILDYYDTDYRAHFIRTSEKYKDFIEKACEEKGIRCLNHTSDERITKEEMTRIFGDDLGRQHIVIMVKGLLRRANLIPNDWKYKIGAMHERCAKTLDCNVCVQAFPGRMSGYWKQKIESGHKTGPYRTSIRAIREYLANYDDPHGNTPYTTALSKPFVHSRNIKNMVPEIGIINATNPVPKDPIVKKFNTQKEVKEYYNKELKPTRGGYGPKEMKINPDGWYECIFNKNKSVKTYEDVQANIKRGFTKAKDNFRLYACYENREDKETLQFWFVHY